MPVAGLNLVTSIKLKGWMKVLRYSDLQPSMSGNPYREKVTFELKENVAYGPVPVVLLIGKFDCITFFI